MPNSSVEVDFIFTIHTMMPVFEKEFSEVLASLNPDVVLVEMDDSDLLNQRLSGYPAEMIYGAQWAESHGKPAHGFDCNIDTKPSGLSKKIRKKADRKYDEFMRGKTWRDENNPKIASQIVELSKPYTDSEKMDKRERCMLRNIRTFLPQNGRVLVITGGYHSVFFRKQLPEAVFPLTPEQ